MAVNVRVTGPELLQEENRRAFLRIEESVRQYSAHTRESIHLVRRPFEYSDDHFVLLWTHGIAVVHMSLAPGMIRGSQSGAWYSDFQVKEYANHSSPVRARKDRQAEAFPNSYLTLEGIRNELWELLPEPSEDAPPIAMVALFTAASDVEAEHIKDPLFSALTIEEALARSIMHRPNLLRVSEQPGASYSNEELDRMSSPIENAAHHWERNTTTSGRELGTVPERRSPTSIPSALRERPRHSPYWLVLVLVALAAFTYIMLRVILIRSSPSQTVTVPKPVSHAPSKIIIQTPVEAELFISALQFQSRSQLDRALTYGEGLRFLPDTEHVVIMDSLTLANGVYGYFKVEETWRKGMLLQTLSHTDTIDIVKFLDPLP